MKQSNTIPTNSTSFTSLLDDQRHLINQARNRVAVNVNAELTNPSNWHIYLIISHNEGLFGLLYS